MIKPSTYQPPYTITPEILNRVAAISEAIGRLTVLTDQTRALRLRRINRVRTIHGSLAIEGNTLSEAQITAILEGKRVIAPPREVQEVKNALAAYDRFDTWKPGVEKDLLEATEELGTGVIAFTPLAQGLLTDKYLNGVPADARVNRPGGGSLLPSHLSEANLAQVRGLNEIARRRGQSLAQMALAWTLRDPRVTSALIGASRPEQIIENVGALNNLRFSAEELAQIDRFAQEGGINLWERPSTAE